MVIAEIRVGGVYDIGELNVQLKVILYEAMGEDPCPRFEVHCPYLHLHNYEDNIFDKT